MGGGVINRKYKLDLAPNFKITPEPRSEFIKNLMKDANAPGEDKIAQQKYYLYATPYIGYKINDNFDIYVTGGIRMVTSKYYSFDDDSKTKNTWHPTVGLGAHYTFSNGVFMKFEYGQVFKKKKEFSGEEDDKEDGILTKNTGKVKYITVKIS